MRKQTISCLCTGKASLPHFPQTSPTVIVMPHPLMQQECHLTGLAMWKLLTYLQGGIIFFFPSSSGCSSLHLPNTEQKHGAELPCMADATSILVCKYCWNSIKVSDMISHSSSFFFTQWKDCTVSLTWFHTAHSKVMSAGSDQPFVQNPETISRSYTFLKCKLIWNDHWSYCCPWYYIWWLLNWNFI